MTGQLEMPKSATLFVPDDEVTPDPALKKRSRRRFTLQYKLRIIAEVDQCRHGELGALLRRKRPFQT